MSHCDKLKQPCATPYQCASGADCRIKPLQQANSDGSSQGHGLSLTGWLICYCSAGFIAGLIYGAYLYFGA